MAYAYVKGVRMYYEEIANEKPALLLVHGAAQDTLSWRFNLQALSRWFYVYAIDLPGHGKSQLAPTGPIDDLEVYALYVNAFADTMNLMRYAVMGHSMAGGIALHMALHRPEAVTAVFLVDGACYTSGTYGDEMFELVAINPVDWFEVNFRTICSRSTDPGRIEEIAFDVRRCAPEVAFNDIRAYAKLDLRGKMADVKTPLIAIHGEDDWSIPCELGKKTLEMAGGPTIYLPLNNVGHFPHTESPSVFNSAVEEAMKQLESLVKFQ